MAFFFAAFFLVAFFRVAFFFAAFFLVAFFFVTRFFDAARFLVAFFFAAIMASCLGLMYERISEWIRYWVYRHIASISDTTLRLPYTLT